ncbi:alpha/beta hydrolase [Ramlibacter rhizophilus]|uniref:Alpha/beta hydrolase n=1 Tax=Ramlibacter rhizophilus TaxID=1781167 RepID=A0A4Z0BEM6_9BURK|nr:alpha/beta hydrolase [Ramlibacter rhizophilus]TFY96913.1 alpha/beta hydrolase [Ramlibacter rhizophilus]
MKLDDPQWLEEQYDNRARVPDHGDYFARWASESDAVRASLPCTLDIPYGKAPRERLDVFPAAQVPGRAAKAGAPVMVFIHGGYWRSLDKEMHAFVARPFVEAGACVVLPEYTLCPEVTVPQIVLQQVQALAWCARNIADHGGDPARITVVGHSAGAHLAAMLLACRWDAVDARLPPGLLTQALAISGLYELEPLRHTPSIQASLHLTPSDVDKASPARLPPPAEGSLSTVVGGRESMEFLRHNELIRQAWGSAHVPVCEALPGLNHFSVLDALVAPGHELHRLARQLLAP